MNKEMNNFLLTEEEQEKYFPLDPATKKKWQKWVPDGYQITNMQIYEAMSRGIPVPTGDPRFDQEYIMFLNEFILLPKKEKTIEINKTPPRRIEEGERTTGDNYFGGSGLIGKPKIPFGEPYPELFGDLKDEFQDNLPVRTEDVIPPTKIENIIPEEIKEVFEKSIEEELEKNNEDQLVRIVERRKANLLPIILAALLALLMTCFRIVGPFSEKEFEHFVNETLDYVITENISYEDAFRIKASDIRIGDEHYLEDGLAFNTNSLMSGDSTVKGVTKEMGKEFSLEDKFSGVYPITGFAIIRNSDNKLLAYIEDFYSPQYNTKLSTFVDETLKGTDIGYEDIRVEFHFGRTDYKTGERSRLGWIDNGDIVFDQDGIKKIIDEAATYQGTIKNFSGDYIIINTQSGEVSIPVKDSQGNYYKAGDIVIGSDNKEYEISQLDLEQENQTIEKEVEKSGKQLTFNLKDCNLLIAAPFLALALAKYLEMRKKNKAAENNPYFDLVEKTEVADYIDNFRQERGRSSKIHVGTLTDKDKLEKIVIEGYYKKTGILIIDIDELEYGLNEENKFIVYNKSQPGMPAIDITDYIIEATKIGESIGEGWDERAEEYFVGKGRGPHA